MAIIILVILSQPCFATQEALYKYNSQQTIQLTLNSAPVETKSGFMRLAGIISNSSFLALIEIGGKGMIAKTGDRIADYKVKKIDRNGATICLGN